MKVSEIHARQFAKDEYGGFEHTNVAGQNLLVYGGNRTGKTLTFNAILYNLLGPRHTIDLSTGRQNDVRLKFDDDVEFQRAQAGAMFRRNGTEETGDTAQDSFAEWFGDEIDGTINRSDIIKAHFLHSHIDRMPLSRLSKQDRLAIIRSVADIESQEQIEELEGQLEELEDSINEDREDRRRLIEDRQQLQREQSSAQNQLEKYVQLRELHESGELTEITDLLLSNEKIQEQLADLSREEEFLRQKRRSKQKQKSQWERYRQAERHSLIAEAVNDFVCPACGDRVDTELAESRLSRHRCPFCAVDDRADSLETNLDDKISRSEEELEEIESELEEITADLDEVDERMDELREQQPELSDVDGPIETVIRENDYEVDQIVAETTDELERYESTMTRAETALEETNTQIEDLDTQIEDKEDHYRSLAEELEEQRQASIEAEIDEFGEAWLDSFQSAAGEIGLEIRITEDGEIEIPGNESPRSYDQAGDLSDAEITFLNITFAVTLNDFARQSGLTDWKTIVLDEPFSNLDSEGEENLLEFIREREQQFICTSSDETFLDEFDKHGELPRHTIQSSLTRFS
ncbi:AAA family ATPase [Natronococcus wangiae]|uniref:AAA family ATPase n=1 Tax=Natronococcus wangiae TaxID=3068275 RepID=UPI00273E5644|nr:AAA family ATPase [Natronococcus sp. AD5]